MAAVQNPVRASRNRVRDHGGAGQHPDLAGADLLDHVDGRQAAKPRPPTNPPTMLFEPEMSPFVKLFTKRVAAAQGSADAGRKRRRPGGSDMVFDGGEKITRSGSGEIQPSGYPNRFINSLIVAITLHAAGRRHGNLHRLRLLALQGEGEADLFLHPVDADASACCRGDPDVLHVPRRWP